MNDVNIPDAPVRQPDAAQTPVISMGEWMITLLLMAIPLVNLIMLLVWAFGGGANPTKANWAKAYLIWMLIGILFVLMFFSSIVAAIAAFS